MLLNLYLVKREKDNLGINKTMYKTNIRKNVTMFNYTSRQSFTIALPNTFLNFAENIIKSVVVVVMGSLNLY